MKNRENLLIGSKFKSWTVISEPLVKWNREAYLCKCDCGNESTIVRKRIEDDTSHFMCRGCFLRAMNFKKRGIGSATIGDFSGKFLNQISKAAKSRGLEYSVSKEYLWDLFLKQNKKCALSGIKIASSLEKNKRELRYDLITASLDRIDSRFGYIEGNVQWVHKLVNIMKSTLSEREFIYLCTKISRFRKANFEPSLEVGNFKYSRKAQRLTSDDFPSNNLDTSARHPVVLLDDDIV